MWRGKEQNGSGYEARLMVISTYIRTAQMLLRIWIFKFLKDCNMCCKTIGL